MLQVFPLLTSKRMQATALHIAAREGQLLALYRLITTHSVDVNIKDAWGWTPADSAVMAEQWPSAVLLTSWGGMLQIALFFQTIPRMV
jgi:ankyrin repeat protein